MLFRSTTPMRSQHRKELRALMFQLYEPWKKRPKAEVLAELRAVNVPSGAVNNLGEVFADPQVQHLQATADVQHPKLGKLTLLNQTVKLSRTPAKLVAATPERGGHTDEVLTEIGYTGADIARFRAAGVV